MMLKKLLALMLVVLVVAVSCKKDEKDDETTPTPTPRTVEENKTNIESAGVEMVSEISALKDDPSISTTESLVSFMDQGTLFEDKKGTKNSGLFSIFYEISDFANGDSKLFDLFTTMKAPTKGDDDPEGPQELFDEIKGVYTWNKDSSDWDYKETGTAIVFEFPSTENGTSNDAKLTLTYTGKAISNTSIIEDYEGDIPTLVNAKITVGTTTVIEYKFSATYDSDDMPTAVSTSLALGTFVFAVDLINTTSAVSINYSFKHGTKILLDIGAGTNGNFDKDNIEKYTNDDDAEYTDIDEVVTSVNAHFQILTVKIAGDLNVDKLVDDVEVLEDKYDNDNTLTEDQLTNDLVGTVNTRLDLAVYYTPDNSKVADVEAYTYTETDTWMEWVWDETIQDYVEEEVTEEYLEVDFRFVFTDGTKSDAETYFGEGFADVITALNDFINELNKDYDLDLEEIED